MPTDLRKQIITVLVGIAAGVLSTWALVWRDVAVIKAEIQHIQTDVSTIQRFIVNDDPKAFLAAKEQIREDHKTDKTPPN